MSLDLLEGGIRALGFLLPILLFVAVPTGLGLWLLTRILRVFAARRRNQATRAVVAG